MRSKTRKCIITGCKQRFAPSNSMHKACSVEHALLIVKQMREGRERVDIFNRKEALKTRSEHLKEAQSIFNAYIRERDKDLPCISCRRHHGGQYHAGHYLAIGSHPELRFDELNVNKQCAPCNLHLSGNQINYRLGLIEKIGAEKVMLLEQSHPAKKYIIADILDIKTEYKAKYKKLKLTNN